MALKPVSSNARIRRIMKFMKQQQIYNVNQIDTELKEIAIRSDQAQRKIQSLNAQIARIENAYKKTFLALRYAAVMLKQLRVRMDLKRNEQCKEEPGVFRNFALIKTEDLSASGGRTLNCLQPCFSTPTLSGFGESNIEEDIHKANILISQIESFQTELQKLGYHLRSLILQKQAIRRLAMNQKAIESDLLQQKNALQQEADVLALSS
eukprot:CAMPEP_0194577600 /NCGR_PEP_ID=MMETSP0292-20121207/12322_1 /TAXON_ID=39354 /ORGANISM="Heterosigma akashiwo, Strain CCMP2393" /LENGTH=207 /DNA_ID=CAMNT_0039430025 /DNA_START=39 /DNA_END=662 /DNA_ORIENTATION=+